MVRSVCSAPASARGIPWARLPYAALPLATPPGMSPAPAHGRVGSITMVWGHGRWSPPHPVAMAPGVEPEASGRMASPVPTTYPSSAAQWLWAPPAAQRVGPPSPRSRCWAAAPPVRAMSARHPGPPCACPALREPAQQSLGGSGQRVPPPPSCPSSLGPPAEGEQALGWAPTCEGRPGEPVAGGTANRLPGQQHALRRDVVDGQVLHAHQAPCR